ncbi:MAG TPA: Calx-beta domain-containing protein [Actinomycetota bacterium]|nr:Calx-beta domain-containing protein [Actinomycetota bacterium]
MRLKRRLGAGAVMALIATLVVAPMPAGASFHNMKIVEVYVGSQNDDSQYVVLQMYTAGQSFVGGQQITVFNSQGNQVDTFTFTANVSNGADQAKILAATTQAQALFNVSADLTIDPSMSADGGKACFSTIDCVAWGNYSGSATGVGTPEDPDGFHTRHQAIARRLDTSSPPTALDAGDDTNSSSNDFVIANAAPRNNAGQQGIFDPCFFLSESALTVPEDEGTLNIMIEGGVGGASIDYVTTAGSAASDEDFDGTDGTVVSGNDPQNTNAQIGINIVDDGNDESDETFDVGISNAHTGVTQHDLCFDTSTTVTIQDDDGPPDNTDPLTTITKPVHHATYRKSRLSRLKGTSDDGGGSGVVAVEVRLRKKMKNGNCKFWNGGEFAALPCSSDFWLGAQGSIVWTYALTKTLSPSIGTKTKNYTLFARATDAELNTESVFAVGRNANTFEIKP